jgi:enamine deaminase RidA (YjgF/YER057c/UK114 family)
MGEISARLQALGISLPPAAAPVANYVGWVRHGDLVFTAGQLPFDASGELRHTGVVGADVSVETAAAAARLCALNCIAQAAAAAGGVDGIRRVLKLVGFVRSAPDFAGQPQVLNGASDLMVEIFGEAGRHARSAVGVSALPMGACVEVEAVFEVG